MMPSQVETTVMPPVPLQELALFSTSTTTQPAPSSIKLKLILKAAPKRRDDNSALIPLAYYSSSIEQGIDTAENTEENARINRHLLQSSPRARGTPMIRS
jgi:hypothetical protein